MSKVLLNWLFCGCLFIFGLLIVLGSIEKRLLHGVCAGFIFVLIAIVISPYIGKKIEKVRGFPLMLGQKVLIALFGLVIALIFIIQKKEGTAIQKVETQQASSLSVRSLQTKVKSLDIAEFQKQLSTELGALPAHWQSVTVDKLEDTTYGATLNYKDSPSGGKFQFDVEGKVIVKAMLKVLINNGRNPSDELLNVRVSLQEPVVGETGKKLVRFFGRSKYNPLNDQIEFSDKLYGF